MNILEENKALVPYKVAMVLDYPSPHMEDLIQAFARRPGVGLKVFYRLRSNPFRGWYVTPAGYPHEYGAGPELRIRAGVYREAFKLDVRNILPSRFHNYDIVIDGERLTSISGQLTMLGLTLQGRCWAFMNEAPGMQRHKGVLKALRRLCLYLPVRCASGILGHGRSAGKAYRILTRGKKAIFNIPYVCRMDRFRTGIGAPRLAAAGCRFLFVGQLVRRKRAQIILEALNIAGLRGAQLDIVGDGPQRGELELQVRTLGLESVRFHGHIPFDKIHEWFRSADVFILPSVHDGWGMVVVEALAAGLPVIASRGVGAARQFIRNGENGYMFRRDDPVELASQMRAVWDSPELLRRMKHNASASVADFTPDLVAEHLHLAIGEIVKEHVGAYWDSKAGLASQHKENKGTHRWLSQTRSMLRHAYLTASGHILHGRHVKHSGVRILCYHHFSQNVAKGFEQQLSFLSDHFKIVPLRDALVLLAAKNEHMEPTLVITMDDGFKEQAAIAASALSKYSIKACFFVPAAFAAIEEDNREELEHYALMVFHAESIRANLGWADLRQLVAEGHEVGSHGLTHLPLNTLNEMQINNEIGDSKRLLETQLGVPVMHFAYPYGKCAPYKTEIAGTLQRYGYVSGLTLQRGINTSSTDTYALRRDHIEARWPLSHMRHFLSRS